MTSSDTASNFLASRARQIQTLELIGQDRAFGLATRTNHNFEGVALDLRSDRAKQRKTHLSVVRTRRHDECGSTAGLLVAFLAAQTEARRCRLARGYTVFGLPHFTADGRTGIEFAVQIVGSNTRQKLLEHDGFAFDKPNHEPAILQKQFYRRASLTGTSSAIALGIRNPKLLPHLTTFVRMPDLRIYIEYTQCPAAGQVRRALDRRHSR